MPFIILLSPDAIADIDEGLNITIQSRRVLVLNLLTLLMPISEKSAKYPQLLQSGMTI